MDLEDYTDNLIIGPGNIQPDCAKIADPIVSTARGARDAFLKSIENFIESATRGVHLQTSQILVDIKNYIDAGYVAEFQDFFTKHEILFNSLLCADDETKIVGNENYQYPIFFIYSADPYSDSGKITQGEPGTFNIDYSTSQTYQKSYLDDYKEAHQTLLCTVKKLIAYLIDQRPGEGDIQPDVPENGYCPPYSPAL